MKRILNLCPLTLDFNIKKIFLTTSHFVFISPILNKKASLMDLAREKGGVKMPSDYQQKPCQKINLVLFY